eukprot:7774934-Alexandrium_andersonii.AAC.1
MVPSRTSVISSPSQINTHSHIAPRKRRRNKRRFRLQSTMQGGIKTLPFGLLAGASGRRVPAAPQTGRPCRRPARPPRRRLVHRPAWLLCWGQ